MLNKDKYKSKINYLRSRDNKRESNCEFRKRVILGPKYGEEDFHCMRWDKEEKKWYAYMTCEECNADWKLWLYEEVEEAANERIHTFNI